MKIVCIIPIKLNSVRLPNKNIKILNNEPLCSYIFKTICKIESIDEIYCFCSDENIKKYLPDKIRFLKRDKTLDTDETKINDVYKMFINKIDADIYVSTHVTSPFLTKETINICIKKVVNGNYDSSFTGTYVQDFLWYNNKPFNYNLDNIPRTQDLNNIIKETSGIYVFNKNIFIEYNRRIGFNPYIHIVDSKEATDIDTIHDFKLAELLIKNKI
jgi:CMP-N-acetylneuraminic acid synthetase